MYRLFLFLIVLNGAAFAADSFLLAPDTRSFEERREELLARAAQGGAGGGFEESARIHAGLPAEAKVLRQEIERIGRREDCSDFAVHGLLRLLYQFGDRPELDPALKAELIETLLAFKYWPDEPGVDSMCYWSENHHLLFGAAGYLAGQMFPEAVFSNSGHTGREKMDRHRPRVLRWLEMRFRTGFSEWLSNVYYEEDLYGLLNLADFAQDDEIRTKAAMVTDLLLADIALNSYRGGFGSTHGRTYEGHKKSARRDSTGLSAWLLFGLGSPESGGHSAALSLALSPGYRVPPVLQSIAADVERPETINRQRMGIKVEEAKRWGLSYHDPEDGMVFFSLEAYNHPKVIGLTLDMFDAYRWWENDFFKPYGRQQGLIDTCRRFGMMPLLARIYEKDLTRNLREEVNIYTYRTPDYMLSTAQDWRKSYGGDQQHIWQATLGPDAVCFTTHPVTCDERSPGYWVGSGTLPRTVQDGNVVIALYKIRMNKGLYVRNNLEFTHAWLPKDAFDEYEARAGWHFVRKGDGYLALWSRQPTRWQDNENRDKDSELIAPGKKNVWICELGRRDTDGSFEEFMRRITEAPLRVRGLSVEYQSPSRGRLEFGWRSPLRREGQRVSTTDYPRYDSPYGHAEFPADSVHFEHAGQSLRLEWDPPSRNVE